MSPEQLSGDRLDGRSDIYALALVAFHMLSGHLPFPSETSQESMIMRLTERPKSLSEMRPQVAWPAAVQAVMDRALERNAKARYATASDFGRALYGAVLDMPASAEGTAGTLVMDGVTATVPPTRMAPAGPTDAARARRNRGPMLIGGGVAAVLVLGGAMYVSRRDDGSLRAAPDSARAPAAPITTPLATSLALPVGEVAGRTETASVPGTRKPARVVAASGNAARVSFMAELRAIDRRAEDERTAQRALDETDAIRDRVTLNDERVYLAIVRAQAFGTLGQDVRSCSELKQVAPRAKSTSYDSKLSAMLANCP